MRDPSRPPRVERALARALLRLRGRRVLCAVSGGPDSLALWLAARAVAADAGVDVIAAHVHHGLRAAADADAAFVRDLARATGARAIVLRAGPRIAAARARGNGGGIENIARTVRYALLRRAARRTGADAILVAHTADDQAETVLMRLARGAGLRGLGGMRRALRLDGTLVLRPLLAVTRGDVQAYVARSGVVPRADETNEDDTRERAWVRRHLLAPMRERHGDGVALRLARAAAIARSTERAMGALATRGLREAGSGSAPGEFALAAQLVASYDPAVQRSVVRAAIEQVTGSLRGLSARHVENVLGLLHTSSAVQLPRGFRAVRRGDRLVFERVPPRGIDDAGFAVPVTVPGVLDLPDGRRLSITLRSPDQWCGPGTAGDWSASFDCDALAPPLVARFPHAGDRMRPMGLRGSRKVSDLLSEAHVPRHARGRQVVIADAAGIVWLPGVRRGEAAPVGPSTRRIVEATLEWVTHPWI